jgi:hypothetical protein
LRKTNCGTLQTIINKEIKVEEIKKEDERQEGKKERQKERKKENFTYPQTFTL